MKLCAVCATSLMCLTGFAQAQGQQVSESNFQLLIDTLAVQAEPRKRLTMFGVPTAGVAASGRIFGSASMVSPRGGVDGAGLDFDTAFGFGIGSETESVGVQVTANVTGTNPFGDAGYFGLKFGRRLVDGPNPTSAALSISKLAPWGSIGNNTDASVTLVVTHLNSFSLGDTEYPVMVTSGYGNQTLGGEPGAFLGFGVGLTSNFGMSLSGNVEQINAGVGLSIPGIDGLSISTGFNDITDSNDQRQFSLSVSYSFASPFGGRQ